jgi:hypothetical protein
MEKRDFIGFPIGDAIVGVIVLVLMMTGKLEWYFAIPIIVYISDIKLTER